MIATAGASAHAGDWYGGVTGDRTHVELWRGFGWEIGGETTGYSLRGGLRLTDHFAVDFRLARAADLQWTEYGIESPDPEAYTGHTVFDMTAFQASAMGIVPFGRIWEFYGKGGIAYSRLNGRQELESWWGAPLSLRSVSENGLDYVLGLGIGATVADGWYVHIGYEFFEFDESFLGASFADAASIDSLALGFQRRFRSREER